ncbi:MAG: YHYH domain-containing protein [Gammaproteobacteria bacterium]|nr:YHYH domain-containing protein [Gammaproteobacteria bacterium]
MDRAHAHGGGLAADGCHNDRSTGTRHCHERGSKKPSKPNTGRNNARPSPATGRQNNATPSINTSRDNATSGDCSGIKYNRQEWSFRGHKFNTSTGHYSGLQCSKIDADHVISLKDAHESGGCQWSRNQKRNFANDPENLVPSCAHINRSKGARLPAKFIKGASDNRGVDFNFPTERVCSYLAIYKKVKDKYKLSYTNNNPTVFSRCNLRLVI